MLNKIHFLPFAITLPLLAACGGGDGTATDQTMASQPSFSLAVSDAPVDALTEVVVCFNQIELKGDSADTVFTVGSENGMIAANDLCLNANNEIIPNTVGIDLLSYTGSNSITLVDDITIGAGNYSQMRLIISEGSYGIDAQTQASIAVSVPSNELKLDGFTATLGSTVDFTLEFDLNKAMTNPVGKSGYFLKPRGVRLVNNTQAGHIAGTVTETLLVNNQCSPLSDSAINVASVYLYEGSDLAIETLADNDGDETNQPLASAAVTFNSEQSTYDFAIGFVNAGNYTIAATCDTSDDPEADDVVTFITTQNVSVVAGNQATQVSFDVSAE
ncbi:MAG: DUF4382 domain-containing protein [Thalassotalea sp.]